MTWSDKIIEKSKEHLTILRESRDEITGLIIISQQMIAFVRVTQAHGQNRDRRANHLIGDGTSAASYQRPARYTRIRRGKV